MLSTIPFLEALKLSCGETYSISYTSVVFGKIALSLFILYTAYLNATSVVLSLSSWVKIAPEKELICQKSYKKYAIQCNTILYILYIYDFFIQLKRSLKWIPL